VCLPSATFHSAPVGYDSGLSVPAHGAGAKTARSEICYVCDMGTGLDAQRYGS